MTRRQTRSELITNVQTQVELLRRAAEHFDTGIDAEALTLATRIRVLVHDTDRSHSLLALLDVKDKLEFEDTALGVEPDTVYAWGLLAMRGGRYIAKLGGGAPSQPRKAFEPWWTNGITMTWEGEVFSRKSFVLGLANKDGGDHVDPILTEKWHGLTRGNALRVKTGSSEGGIIAMGNPAFASVRQIAYELDVTLQDQLGGLL